MLQYVEIDPIFTSPLKCSMDSVIPIKFWLELYLLLTTNYTQNGSASFAFYRNNHFKFPIFKSKYVHTFKIFVLWKFSIIFEYIKDSLYVLKLLLMIQQKRVNKTARKINYKMNFLARYSFSLGLSAYNICFMGENLLSLKTTIYFS
jgi:hypothetical protein